MYTVSYITCELQSLKLDLSLAAHVVEETRTCSSLLNYYRPYSILHGEPAHMLRCNHIHQTGARAYLIMHGALRDSDMLHDLQVAKDALLDAPNRQPSLWRACQDSCVASVPKPPLPCRALHLCVSERTHVMVLCFLCIRQ